MGLNEHREIVLGPKNFEEAINWFKNFKPKDDNSKDFVENIPVRLPENPAQKVWDSIHAAPMDLSHITDVNYWKSELDKCIESEEYFYNNYCLVNGKKPNPVPERYFKNIRIIQGRRKGISRFIPKKNTQALVFESVCKRYTNLLNIDRTYGKE